MRLESQLISPPPPDPSILFFFLPTKSLVSLSILFYSLSFLNVKKSSLGFYLYFAHNRSSSFLKDILKRRFVHSFVFIQQISNGCQLCVSSMVPLYGAIEERGMKQEINIGWLSLLEAKLLRSAQNMGGSPQAERFTPCWGSEF